jgi:hypothetical protein
LVEPDLAGGESRPDKEFRLSSDPSFAWHR